MGFFDSLFRGIVKEGGKSLGNWLDGKQDEYYNNIADIYNTATRQHDAGKAAEALNNYKIVDSKGVSKLASLEHGALMYMAMCEDSLELEYYKDSAFYGEKAIKHSHFSSLTYDRRAAVYYNVALAYANMEQMNSCINMFQSAFRIDKSLIRILCNNSSCDVITKTQEFQKMVSSL